MASGGRSDLLFVLTLLLMPIFLPLFLSMIFHATGGRQQATHPMPPHHFTTPLCCESPRGSALHAAARSRFANGGGAQGTDTTPLVKKTNPLSRLGNRR